MRSAATPQRAIVLATWNVHGFRGADGRRAPQRVAAVIRELGADLVALQEVDLDEGSGGAVATLERETGLAAHLAPTWSRPQGPFGNAVLTRAPVRRIVRHDLSVAGREPRGALELELALGSHPLRVLATHLGLRARERAQQARRLAALLADRSDARWTVVLGDLNDWRGLRRSCLRALSPRFGPERSPATFPARWPLLALDRVLAHPAARLGPLRAHRSPTARLASDHLPLVARLDVADAAERAGEGATPVPRGAGGARRRRAAPPQTSSP